MRHATATGESKMTDANGQELKIGDAVSSKWDRNTTGTITWIDEAEGATIETSYGSTWYSEPRDLERA